MPCNQSVEVGGDGLGVGLIFDPQVLDTTALPFQKPGEVAHGGEDRENLLRMMQDIVGLLTHLHHHVHNTRVRAVEPRVH